MPSEISLSREELVFVKREALDTGPGSIALVAPTVNDIVLVTGVGEITQQIEKLEDEQRRDTRSRLPMILGRLPPGTWNFPTYIKPSGTAGTKPEGAALWESLLGKETVTASTKVDYTLANELPSFSMWVKRGHTVFTHRGCTVNRGEATVAGNAIGNMAWSGQFIEQGVAGTSKLLAAVATAATTITLPAGEAKRFTATSTLAPLLAIEADATAGSTFEVVKVTAVNYSTDVLTVTRAQLGTVASVVSHPANAVIRGWTPTLNPAVGAETTANGGTVSEVGKPVHGKLGIATDGGTNIIILAGKVTIENGIKYYEDEKNGSLTAEQYSVPSFRTVTVGLSKYFRKEDAVDWAHAKDQTFKNMVFPLGSIAGSICEFSCPKLEGMTPKMTGDPEVTLDVEFRAVASNLASQNDEAKVTFR